MCSHGNKEFYYNCYVHVEITREKPCLELTATLWLCSSLTTTGTIVNLATLNVTETELILIYNRFVSNANQSSN